MRYLKNNMRKYITFTLVLLVIAACKTKKTVAEQIVSEQPVTKNKAREIIQKHYENLLSFETASIRSSADYEDKKQSISINADIRIKKDEIIWINLKFFGIPMAKAFITPTRVSYYEKANNTYFDGNYSILTKMLGTDLDFQKVQNLLLGRPIDNLTKEEFIAEIADNLFQLKSKNKTDIEKSFSFETANYLLKKQFINQISQNRNVLVNYPSFTNQDNMFLPTGVSILANQQDQVKINVEYKKITFNEPLSYPYSIPDGYSQIKID
jgi:nucleoid DNA-binding protein